MKVSSFSIVACFYRVDPNGLGKQNGIEEEKKTMQTIEMRRPHKIIITKHTQHKAC